MHVIWLFKGGKADKLSLMLLRWRSFVLKVSKRVCSIYNVLATMTAQNCSNESNCQTGLEDHSRKQFKYLDLYFRVQKLEYKIKWTIAGRGTARWCHCFSSLVHHLNYRVSPAISYLQKNKRTLADPGGPFRPWPPKRVENRDKFSHIKTKNILLRKVWLRTLLAVQGSEIRWVFKFQGKFLKFAPPPKAQVYIRQCKRTYR